MMTISNENSQYMRLHGTLIIRSKPSHAVVIVDGKENVTPVFFYLDERDLPYDVIIKKEGYTDYTQNVVVQRGSKIEINAVLRKKIRTKS